nr:helix-turn-helix transcriptional regulator [uncultured Oscillibacter sp.]
MNKQQFGNFIAENRKAAGLTQKELAARVHVTDKAVSKWERALSYPDVTLLEPLAEALGLGVEELMACRRIEVRKDEEEEAVENIREERPVQNLMEISRENLKSERRKHVWQTALALALMLAATLGTIWYCSTFVSEQLDKSIVLKETVGDENYLYVEDKGHLLRLKCGADVDFDSITLESEWGSERSYRMDCRWNRRTYEGTVSTCQFSGEFLGGMMDVTFEVESDRLFWYDEVYYTSEDYYPDPYSEPRGLLYLCNYRFWTGKWDRETGEWKDRETVLLVEDCLNVIVEDIDGDGHNEVVARTRWPEKPYMVYDWGDDFKVKEIDQYWLENVSPELQERLLTIPEESARAQARLGSHPPVVGEIL